MAFFKIKIQTSCNKLVFLWIPITTKYITLNKYILKQKQQLSEFQNLFKKG